MYMYKDFFKNAKENKFHFKKCKNNNKLTVE